MSNITGKMNLAKFKNSLIIPFNKEVNGVPAGEEWICIPIKINNLFKGDKGGVWFDFFAFLSDEIKGMTHAIKQSFSKEKLQKMTKEEYEGRPFFGNLNACGTQSAKAPDIKPNAAPQQPENLPF